MNNWVKLIDEYKVHNHMLQKMLREKNEEIRELSEKVEELEQQNKRYREYFQAIMKSRDDLERSFALAAEALEGEEE